MSREADLGARAIAATLGVVREELDPDDWSGVLSSLTSLVAREHSRRLLAGPDDEAVAHAAAFAVPGGRQEGRTLEEIAALGDDGEAWLLYHAKRGGSFGVEFAEVCRVFIEGRLPEVWKRHQVWQETEDRGS